MVKVKVLDEITNVRVINDPETEVNVGGNVYRGMDGATFTPNVTQQGVISWTNDQRLPNPEPVNIKGVPGNPGQPGEPGKDGHTPVITAVKSGDSTTIYADGTAIATIEDGERGEPGSPGAPGHSPVITATKSGSVTTIYSDGVAIAEVDDGEDGNPGKDGVTFTPSVTAQGVISWTNDGGLPNPQSQSIKGVQGDPGDDYVLTSEDKAEIAGIVESQITIPTQVSDLINDAGYLTLSTLPIYSGGVS